MTKGIGDGSFAKVGLQALATNAAPIDAFCMGHQWKAKDENYLSRLIALIAMGQATQAAHIIRELAPATPAFTAKELIADGRTL